MSAEGILSGFKKKPNKNKILETGEVVVEEKKNQIFLRGPITEISGQHFLRSLDLFEQKKPKHLHILINSNGGNNSYVVEICNKILFLRKNILIIGIVKKGGLAYSGALFILQTCHWREALDEYSKILIHRIRPIPNCSNEEYKKTKASEKSFFEDIAEKCKKGLEEIEKLADLNKPISSLEAMEFGFLDQVGSLIKK